MEASERGGAGRLLLAYFGLESREKALSVLSWSVPYLLLLGAGLLGLSFAVQWVFPMSLWVHGAALVLSLAYFFLFLARLRRAAEEEGPGDNGGDDRGRGKPPPGGRS